MEWLGQVPEHWEVKRANSFLREQKNVVTPQNLSSCEVYHYSIPVVEESGEGRVEDGNTIDSNKVSLKGNELLVSKLNPRKSRILIAKPQELPIVCSPEFVVMEPIDCYLPFICYFYSLLGLMPRRLRRLFSSCLLVLC